MRGEIKRFILKKGLFRGSEHVLVAVSGGADSVCLLHILRGLVDDLGIRLTAVHLNHGIRGREADGDEEFVIRAGKLLGIEVISEKVNIPLRARRSGKSIEMCARDARYDFFARTARKLGADSVATAHTADDQVETVILNISRGAGLNGVSGIPVESSIKGLRVVRPLLRVERIQIERYLRKRNIRWREDATNQDVSYLRNRVRHEIVPLMKQRLNSSLVRTVSRSAEVLRDDCEYLDNLAVRVWQASRVDSRGGAERSTSLDCGFLASAAGVMRKRVIRVWLLTAGVPVPGITTELVESIDRLITSRKGAGVVDIPGPFRVARRYNRLFLMAGGADIVGKRSFRRRLPLRAELELAEAGVKVTSWVEPGLVRQANTRVGRFPARASISRSSVGRHAVIVRSWCEGDRICPLGMNGSKKLQDVFVDARVPVEARTRIPVFECRGEIIWLPGYRVARGWEVLDPDAPALQLHVDECPDSD